MERELRLNNTPLSIIVPVYNEQDGISDALTTIRDVADQYLSTFEMVIVNDGSQDNSQALIDQFVKTEKRASSFPKAKNEGIGSAIRTGISKCQYEYILPLPVDCPLEGDSLLNFLETIESCDIVVGVRPRRVGYSTRMKINSKVFHFLISVLFKVNHTDYNWIHMYRKNIFDKGKIEITSDSLLMLAEVLIKANRMGYRIKEIEVAQRERLTGTATASKLITVIKTIREIFRLHRTIN